MLSATNSVMMYVRIYESILIDGELRSDFDEYYERIDIIYADS